MPRLDTGDSTSGSSMGAVYLLVAAAGLLTHGLCVTASQCWVYPDSIDYIQLAGGIADRLDFTNELYLVRTPGYPLFLALIFLLAGSKSPIVIVLLQHLMMAATAVLTAGVGFRITANRMVALAAGCLCACSLQLLAYANLVLTEAPYTLVLVAAIHSLVRFVQEGKWRWLASASLLAGVGYLLRPIGLYLLPVCGVLSLRQVWLARDSVSLRRSLLTAMTASALPALLVAAPWMIASAYAHKSLQATRCLDYVYYFRAATVEGLDSTKSETMRDIHAVIAEGQAAGQVPAEADYRDRATVLKAYQAVRGLSFADSSAMLGRAGRDLIREHPWEMLVGTLRYAGWLLLSPDPVYRFQPGGAPGRDGKRDNDAEIFDIATYSVGSGSWEPTLHEYRRHLPLETAPRPATAIWTAAMAWFHRHIECGDPILGVRDSLYEELMLPAALGALISLCMARRAAWWTVGAVLALHVLVSVFFGGAQTRYAAPIRPLLCLYLALIPYVLWSASIRLRGWLRGSSPTPYRGARRLRPIA